MLKLLLNADIYAPEHIGSGNILVCSGKIIHISKEKPVISGPDVETYDAAGKFAFPGFIDSHVHITGGGSEGGFKYKIPPIPLSLYTSAGITTVVGVLGTDDVTRSTSSLVARAYALRSEGISAYCMTGGYHIPPVSLTGSIREDIIHIEPVIGLGEIAISDHRSSQPSFAEFIRFCSESYTAGIISGKSGAVNIHVGGGKERCGMIFKALDNTEIPPRVFYPTHMNRASALVDESVKLTSRGVTVDLTSFPVEEGDDALSAEDCFNLLLKKGVSPQMITISSDGGGSLPEFDSNGRLTGLKVGDSSSLIKTFQGMVFSGNEIPTALMPFTVNPARVLGLPKGTVSPGSDADLLIFDKEMNLESVMARGVWHFMDGVQKIYGTFEQKPAD